MIRCLHGTSLAWGTPRGDNTCPPKNLLYTVWESGTALGKDLVQSSDAQRSQTCRGRRAGADEGIEEP